MKGRKTSRRGIDGASRSLGHPKVVAGKSAPLADERLIQLVIVPSCTHGLRPLKDVALCNFKSD